MWYSPFNARWMWQILDFFLRCGKFPLYFVYNSESGISSLALTLQIVWNLRGRCNWETYVPNFTFCGYYHFVFEKKNICIESSVFLLLLVKALQSRVRFSWSIIKIIASTNFTRVITTAKVIFFSRDEFFLNVEAFTTKIGFISHVSGIAREYGIVSYHSNELWFVFPSRFVLLDHVISRLLIQ